MTLRRSRIESAEESKALGAVTGLKQEGVSRRDGSELTLKRASFPGEYQGRSLRQQLHGMVEVVLVGPVGLVASLVVLP